jgi:heptosyltransferase I
MNERLVITEPRTIAIVMLSALGDAVHVLPVANALKRAWPAARITWVIQPVPHALVRGHRAVDEFIVFQRRRGLRAWRSYTDLRTTFAGRRFDLLLNLQVYLKAGLITALAPAAVKLGFDRARARDLNWLFTNRRIPARPTGHVQDQYFEFLEYLGIDPRPVEWRIDFDEAERAAQRTFFEQIDRPVLAVVAGTSKPAKNWAADRYAQVLDAAWTDLGLQPVLVGGPAPIEREAAARIRDLTRAPVIDAFADDVRRLAWLLDGSRIILSPDTGPLHIARALDRPVVGLYGYSNPKRYGPYRKFEDLIVDGYARYPGEPCEPSMEWRPEGMERVTAEAALEKLTLALARYPDRVRSR